uniref:Uncharacterized protein n=1 Tax=Tetranychus urticae TaxID=32264 RepID=T1KJP6_TETUR
MINQNIMFITLNVNNFSHYNSFLASNTGL